ncbi:4'-phosphopantetheinyl transferase family protein [Agromyces atrinae]|uniref:4'-phosphopantetheinyl transferase n=1 Tax=Agromyces atrinae TaxID=592376 RepID=A0A4V1R2S6_9MICO|nr:4-phosphopantetheinyl transferase [Agromyces atrinae]NYD67606.1 4'-phosphopantetheinyl transferase [Agromyces atrinae]RXZ88186.1 4-phosphopantetheinyl transferase [Agromyces atrinae]
MSRMPLRLPRGVHVSARDSPGDRALDLLTPAERTRFDDETPARAARFLLGRFTLRALALDVTGAPLESIIVRAACPHCGREHGRPRVELANGRRMTASLSFHGGLAVAAVDVGDRPLGIDVSAATLTHDQAAGVEAVLGGPLRDPARAWRAAEATLKADGRGLDRDPTGVRHVLGGTRLDGHRYRVVDRELSPGIRLAVARGRRPG